MTDYSRQNKELIDEIFRILVEEVNMYEGLARTIDSKQKAIVDNDIPSLKKYTGMEQNLIKKSNSLTLTRMDKIQADNPGNDKKETLFNLFLTKYGLLSDETWNHLDNRLKTAVARIKKLNAENSMLLKTSLEFVQGMIKLYYPKDKSDARIYTKEGTNDVKAASVLDYGV